MISEIIIMHYIIRVKFNAHGINTKLKAIRDIY